MRQTIHATPSALRSSHKTQPHLPAPCRFPKISGMDRLALLDSDRILECLQAGPMTTAEIGARLHLSAPRVNGLIQTLNRKGVIHAPRCIKSFKGIAVNLWALRTPLETPHEG